MQFGFFFFLHLKRMIFFSYSVITPSKNEKTFFLYFVQKNTQCSPRPQLPDVNIRQTDIFALSGIKILNKNSWENVDRKLVEI